MPLVLVVVLEDVEAGSDVMARPLLALLLLLLLDDAELEAAEEVDAMALVAAFDGEMDGGSAAVLALLVLQVNGLMGSSTQDDEDEEDDDKDDILE